MTKETRGFVGNATRNENSPDTDNHVFRDQLNCHLALIERQSFKAVKQQLSVAGAANSEHSQPLNIENEALELSNQVMDSLTKDDFKVLRQFKGNSKLSTYITSIIARQAVDMVRKKRGRSREKERAATFGEVGLVIYDEIVVRGNTPEHVISRLKDQKLQIVTRDRIVQILDRIKSKKLEMPSDNVLVHDAVAIPGEEDRRIEIADPEGTPEQNLEETQRVFKMNEVLDIIIRGLSGEERLILRMRFPVTGQKAQKVSQIAGALGITEKAVYKRITRILKKCKTLLEQQGVSLHEIL